MKNKKISLLICSLLFTSTLVSTVSCVGTTSTTASDINSSNTETSKPISSDTNTDKPYSSTSNSSPELPDSDPDGVEERVITTAYGNTKTIKQVENASTDTLIKLIRGRNVIASSENELTYSDELNADDVIEITSDYQYLVIDLFDGLGEQLLYSPSGNFVFQIPSSTIQKTYPANTFSGSSFHFKARVASDEEVTSKTVRNLASNPYDFMYADELNNQEESDLSGHLTDSTAVYEGEVAAYPHAYANRVTRNNAQFFARNAIDNSTDSDGHGDYPHQSWGYDQKSDAEFVIYFGRDVLLSELVFVLRADYSGTKEHDTYWQSATVEFSDGTEKKLTFTKTGKEQEFKLDKDILTSSLRIKDIVAVNNVNSEGYAALTEIKANGVEIVKNNPLAVKTYFHSNFGGKEQGKFTTEDYQVSEIKEKMDKVNDWFIDKTENSTYEIIDSNGTSKMQVKIDDDNWKDAVYYSGLLESFLTAGDMDSYYFMRGVGEQFTYLNHEGYHTPHADHAQIGESYLLLDELKHAEYKVEDTKANIDYCMSWDGKTFPSGGSSIWYDKSRDWSHLGFWWCDALYMALNSYTLLSQLTGDDDYVLTAYDAYNYFKSSLYNETYHLWYRDGKFIGNTTGNTDPNTDKEYPVFWARGNAWVLAALAKQLEYLDEERFPEIYNTYKQDYLDMAETIYKYQRDDGTWNASIIDPDYYEGKEVTGTSGFIYSYCIGLSLGLLDSNTYYPIVKKAYDGILENCSFSDGQIGYMQTTGSSPSSYKSEEFSERFTPEFGMGLFLLACSGMMRICSDYEPVVISLPYDPQTYLIG